MLSATRLDRLSTALLMLASLAVARPASLRAQTSDASVVSGITVHVDAPRGRDTVVYQRTTTRAGKDTSAGTRTVVSWVTQGADGAQLLQVEQRFPAGTGEIVDTAIADLRTLRAVAHRSHQPTKTMRFEFAGNDADGIVTETASTKDSSAAKPIHQPLGGSIFDSNIIDLVVASLPLERGFSAELPFFIYERGGRVPMTVAVRDRSTVDSPTLGRRDAWIVSVAVPGAPATVWVDTKTHAVLRVRYDIAARGMSFTDDRLTPLRGQAMDNSPLATESALMQADRDFAVATHSRGIEGWMSFFAPDAIRIRYRANMVKGYEAIRAFDVANISDTTSTLNWEPTDAYVFRGGDIGSTTGKYSVVSRRSADAGKELGHGRYVTMWRRDGARWLVIMDTGYPEP